MNIRNTLNKLALASLLATATLMAQTPYDEGQKALREQRWMDAAGQFEQAATANEEQADAAVYWRAYALYKAGRSKEAERELRRLERNYPNSNWLKEGQALRIENQDMTRTIEQVSAGGSELDDDLRLYALAQLMNSNPERALPLVLDLVHNSESRSTRNDALFVLALSDEPAAQQAVAEIARNSSDVDLQISAIQILGSNPSDVSLALLADLYSGSTSREVKEAVIHAHVSGDNPATLLDLLRSEQDPELQVEIIHTLGAMGATSELQILYPTLGSGDARLAAIQAFAIAGASSVLREFLASETDPELRRAAIQGIAMQSDGEATETLQSIYTTATSDEEKEAVLEALIMMDDARVMVMEIIATEQNPELQRKAIHVLGIMDGAEELGQLYLSLTDRDSRKAVLEAMSIADDSSGLLRVLETEQDTQLRADAIRHLGITGDKAATAYLAGLYPGATPEDKAAVIESMMIMEDAKGLISLLQQETDPELKRQMLQMLSIMDSQESQDYLFELLEKEG